MKIALINENSQAAKNGIIETALKKVVEPMGHEVVNYGMYAADDAAQLTYVQCGILAAILLNSGAADYVITGCGTGEGAMHCHPHTQVTYIVSGRYRFTIGDETREVGPGDTLLKQDGVMHGCVCLEGGVMMDFFTPMREDFV